MSFEKVAGRIIGFVLAQAILAYLGQWLWNEYAVPAIPALQPISPLQFLAITVLFSMLCYGCIVC